MHECQHKTTSQEIDNSRNQQDVFSLWQVK